MKTGFAIIVLLAFAVAGLVLYLAPGNYLLALTIGLLTIGAAMSTMAAYAYTVITGNQATERDTMRLFERDINERLNKLEHRITLNEENDASVGQLLADSEDFEGSLAKLERKVDEIEHSLETGTYVSTGNVPATQSTDAGEKSANVINLGAAAEARKKKQGVSPTREEAIDGPRNNLTESANISLSKLNIEPLLQPIVSLPHKNLAYYEAFARLITKDGKFLEASQFIPQLEAAGKLREVDLEILNSMVALIRKLQRNGNENQIPGIFWNVSVNSLAKADDVEAIHNALKANAPLASMIIPELDIVSVENADAQMVREISALTRLGYRFSMEVSAQWSGFDKGFSGRNMRKSAQRLLETTAKLPISFLKVPAQLLLLYRDDSDQTMVDMVLPQLEKRNITLVGTQVEREEQAIGLIDNYIQHAQGSFICPPKPVKPDSDGTNSDAASAG